MASDEPHIRIKEIAATCLRSMLGMRSDTKPSCRKSKICKMVTEVATKFLRLHQMEKTCHVALYMRLVDALREACIVLMTPGDTRVLVSRNCSISRWLAGTTGVPGGPVASEEGKSCSRESARAEPLKETPRPQNKAAETNEELGE